jgi:hypothetical protein
MSFNTTVANQISNYDFTDFVYSVLLSRDAALPIKTFHLDVNYYRPVQCPMKSITKWLNFVVQRCVEYLYLRVYSFVSVKLSITILTCKTLVVLKLSGFDAEQGFSYVLLPSLKTLHLKHIRFPGLGDFMLFLTGCPMLEDLLTYWVSSDSEESFDSEESLTCAEWMSSFLTNLARADIECFYHYFPLKAVYNVQSLRFDFHQVCL